MLQNRFKKILVPLDGSLNSIQGLNETISLARQSDAAMTGIYVMPRYSPRVSKILKSYQTELIKNAKKIMSQARTSAARHGITFYEKNTVSGDVVSTIVGYAKSNRSDIIIIGSQGDNSTHKEYLDSIANGVLHDSKMPGAHSKVRG